MASENSKTTDSPAPPGHKNWSIFAIPATYAMAYPPHLYFFGRAMLASGYAYRNSLPRTNLELLKDKLPEGTWQSLVRARGAHMNALEGFPLFASAMLAGNYARLPSKDLNSAAGQYITARLVYTTLYMTTTNEALSYLRTGVYFWSIAIPFWVLWKAGKEIRNRGVDFKTL